jgi:flavin reductase (DIM6/NTAB) family NADH-FMN oxidoreductase RutF
MREPRLLELGEIFENDGLPRFVAHYVLLTSVFEIKRTGLNDAVGAIDCMLEETIERFGVIIAIGRVVDVVVREGEPLLLFRGAYR